MLRVLRIFNSNSTGRIAELVPEMGVETEDAVRLAQLFVRKHGGAVESGSLPDGQSGEQNCFAIDAIGGTVIIRSKCEGPEKRLALVQNLARAFSKVCVRL